MLAKEDFMAIQALAKRGVYQRDIAETVGVHPKTVQRALKRDRETASRPPRRPSLFVVLSTRDNRRTLLLESETGLVVS